MTQSEQSKDDLADERINLLLREIEKEPVPERLLLLARRLQEALNARTAQISETAEPSG